MGNRSLRLFRDLAAVFRGVFRKRNNFQSTRGYQLWLEAYGPNPEDVIDFLIEDFLVHDDLESRDDIPELPRKMLDLPAGSGTFSICSMHANQLRSFGAVVLMKEITTHNRETGSASAHR